MIIRSILILGKKTLLALFFLFLLFRCSDEELISDSTKINSSTELSASESGDGDVVDCSACTYVVPADQPIIDGEVLGLKPGSVIGLSANLLYGSLTFKNIVGTADQPIIIKNCGGITKIDATGKGHAIKMSGSKHFRITGGNADGAYGIEIIGGQMSLNIGGLSSDFEADHLDIRNSGFAGIMAKTDPSCDPATWRENFLMENVSIHHNRIQDTGGEGIYAGNSFFMGMNTSCGVQLPHEIHKISIYKNTFKNTGWESIQLGCATQGASIHSNTIENYGVANKDTQNNGIQIGAGTGGLCYNNLINGGAGHGLTVMGIGDNIIYNNIIVAAGRNGIFCDERYTPGNGFVFLNNTIINPKWDGIKIYAELVPMNVIANNIIANPGNYATNVYPRKPEDAFVSKLNSDVKIEMANNYFTTQTDLLQIIDLAQSDFHLKNTSPVIDQGGDISGYHNIVTDFYGQARVSGSTYDIGAIETLPATAGNSIPGVNAGADVTIALPAKSLYIEGIASDTDGSIVSYEWTKISGGTATLSGATSSTLFADNLTEGVYTFRLTVKDNEGAASSDDVGVTVANLVNALPVANAGQDKSISLPTNSITLYGSGNDSDGSITSYRWSQYGGPTAVIGNANSATANISGLVVAGKYYFRLTVTDNDGAIDYDNMLVNVTESAGETINQLPVANAGPDISLTLPENSIQLHGSGTDSDGSIKSYAWTQYGGAAVPISNAATATPTISGMTAGKYYFRLTVTDNNGATDYDNMLIKVM